VTQVGYKPNGQNEDTCQQVDYQYDQFHGQGSNPIGRLTGMYWSGGPGCIYGFGEEYTYDAQGRIWERAFTMTNSGVTPITLASYFKYDAEGRLTVSQYPAATTSDPTATTTYTTDHDALGRPSDLYSGSWLNPTWLVPQNSATYNAAGQLTAMSTSAYTETRQYNANLQLTRLAAGGGQGIDFSYTYPTSGNNGRISQMTDNITSEQVNYTYDVWNRLVQAGSMTFAYDGFGNLTQQGQTYLSINQNTNQINSAGYQYNANGNVTQTPNPTTFYTYDVANRLVSNGAIYNPGNQRVFDGTYIYLYTPEGKVVGKYTPIWSQYGSNAYIQGGQPNVYFGGKLIQEQGHWVMADRLGSVRVKDTGERSSYQPYGAEVAPATSDQRTKFATYYRDSAGLDYAGQRYYSNVTGRFLTPDPGGVRTANPMDPGSWNRYAYVNGDPVNYNDRHGLFMSARDDGEEDDSDPCDDDPTQIGCPLYDILPPGQATFGNAHPVGPLNIGVMRNRWYEGLTLAVQILARNKDCDALFGLTGPLGNTSPTDPLEVLAKISSSYEFGAIASPANTITSATTTGTGSRTIPIGDGATMLANTGVVIRVNNTANVASFVSGNVSDWATTILHELAMPIGISMVRGRQE